MKQVLIKKGQACVEDTPAPLVEAGTVLVRTQRSCVSVGTEMSGLTNSALPLWKRALQQPDNVKKAVEMAATQGFAKTWQVVQGRLAAGNATGYSATGVVVEVGAGVEDLQPGDRVACAGAQCAHHAEYIRVPRNLTVRVPDALSWDEASTVTLGAIALQGVRRANPTLGETFVVVGLGILGQITAQLLRANGCRVIGTDLDRKRIDLALELGMDVGLHPDDGDPIQQAARLTDGYGADGVIITAASPSDAIVSSAFKLCRKKGRVVLVGAVGLHLNREDFYAKEIDFLISCSYGPGRYDRAYEEAGLDYPLPFVRWTENRNLSEFLRLIADGRVQMKPLISSVYPIAEATQAYASLQDPAQRPLTVLLSYPEAKMSEAPLVRRVDNPAASPAKHPNAIRLALIGGGGFAKGMHLPNLEKMGDLYRLRAVCSRTGHNAAAIARQFGMDYSCTDYAEILRDPEIDAVLIATPHDQHAGQALAALRAGKHVMLEKPLALTRQELSEIERYYAEEAPKSGAPVLLTGFNRRFSPFAQKLKAAITKRSNPLILQYRMNAGHIPLDHWVHGPQGGGRNRGEACHIYDLFTYLVGAKVTDVKTSRLRPQTAHYSGSDNFVATLSFEDGSLATLTYTALGPKTYPKEWLEVYVDGQTHVLEDYFALKNYGGKGGETRQSTQDKGHRTELREFARCLQKGGEWPIPLWQQVQATEIACRVEDELNPTPALEFQMTATEILIARSTDAAPASV